jgi:ankyrin repeat protein
MGTPDLDGKDGNGSTALHLACERGQETVVRLRLDRGLAINDQQTISEEIGTSRPNASTPANRKTKSNPLHLAAIHGHDKVIDMLLQRGA